MQIADQSLNPLLHMYMQGNNWLRTRPFQGMRLGNYDDTAKQYIIHDYINDTAEQLTVCDREFCVYIL